MAPHSPPFKISSAHQPMPAAFIPPVALITPLLMVMVQPTVLLYPPPLNVNTFVCYALV